MSGKSALVLFCLTGVLLLPGCHNSQDEKTPENATPNMDSNDTAHMDACASMPCVNGTCDSDTDGHICTCNSGWDGINCDICAPNYTADARGNCIDYKMVPCNTTEVQLRPNMALVEKEIRLVYRDATGWSAVPDCMTHCIFGWNGESCDNLCVVHVDGSLSDDTGNDGTSWERALATVQEGIDRAEALIDDRADLDSCQVWIAAGTYHPGTTRESTFTLKNGIALYGGFAGNEASLADRDMGQNETILSGDIGEPGINTDNVFHVATFIGGAEAFNSRFNGIVIDGVTIMGGNAIGGNAADNGGGLYMSVGYLDWTGTVVVNDCLFRDNSAAQSGGAILVQATNGWADVGLTLSECTFTNNTAEAGGAVAFSSRNIGATLHISKFDRCIFSNNSAVRGGAVFNYADAYGDLDYGSKRHASPSITNCLFAHNSASQGGAIHNNASADAYIDERLIEMGIQASGYAAASPHLINCTMVNNTATSGGVAYNFAQYSTDGYAEATASTTLENCILSGNSSLIENDTAGNGFGASHISYSAVPNGCDANSDVACGEGNIFDDPMFVNAAGNDYRLQVNSPCINSGNNGAVPSGVTADLAGNPRIYNDASVPLNVVDMGAFEYAPQSR